MRWAHKDKEATKAAKFLDRRSWVGSNSKGLYVRLFGKDMTALREKVFRTHGNACVNSLWDESKAMECMGPLELSHEIPRSLGGSDTAENTRPRCRKHHRLRDGHGCDLHF